VWKLELGEGLVVGEGGNAGNVGGAEVGILQAKIARESTRKKIKPRL
jgi:hypothetical protein